MLNHRPYHRLLFIRSASCSLFVTLGIRKRSKAWIKRGKKEKKCSKMNNAEPDGGNPDAQGFG